MHLNLRTPGRRSRAAAGPAVATAVALGLLSSCGQSSHASSTGTGAITPWSRSAPDGRDARCRRTGNTAGSAPGTTPMPSMSMPMSPPSTSASAAPAAGDAVAIKNFAFSPATLKVKVGTTVTWTIQDRRPHGHQRGIGPRVAFGGPTPTRPTATRSPSPAPTDLCTIHPFMTATVEVTR